MPELPEVEALRVLLSERCVGRSITDVQLVAFSVLKTYAPPLDALLGLEIDAVHRFGKFLDVQAQGVHLAFHLAKAGWLRWKTTQPAAPARPGKGPLALRVTLDDESGFDLTEAGTQRRLAVHVVTDPQQVPAIATLGPDPLAPEFTRDVFEAILARAGRSQLKGLLRDQGTIAGIGNAYSDEVLHRARMSPFTPASALDQSGRALLFAAIGDTLTEAVERAVGLGADQLKDDKRTNLRVHGRTGQPCPVCGTPVAQVSFAESALQYCPGCQTGGKLLADRRLSKLLK